MGAWENGNMESLKYHLYQVDTIDSLSEEMTGTQTTCPKDIANDPFYDLGGAGRWRHCAALAHSEEVNVQES